MLGVITVEYEAAVWTGESMEYQHLSETFSVVLMPDAEPYFLVRYTPIDSDGIYMNLREISLHGWMRGGTVFSIDGTRADLRAYNIDGNNFFMLRDLGDALGFGV